jgi:uncharacterized protein YkwD
MPARRSSRHQTAGGRGWVLPVLCVILAGVAVAVLAFVTTTAAARILLTDGTTTVLGTGCPTSGAGSAPACPAAAPAAQPGTRTAGPLSPAATGSPSTRRPPSRSVAPSPVSTSATSTPPAPSPGAGSDAAVEQVLSVINQARAEAGLPAYTITAGLRSSSGSHNALMAAGCGLSHQCPGEPPIGQRETAAGVPWTAAGENIGEGGPVADTPAAIAQMAVILTNDMLGERPPDDGHRKNLLSRAFRHVGIAVFWSTSGTVWMTQDFSN